MQWLHFRECPRYASGSPGAWPPLTETATECSHYTINHDEEEEEGDDDEQGNDLGNDQKDVDDDSVGMQRMLHVKWQEAFPLFIPNRFCIHIIQVAMGSNKKLLFFLKQRRC